MTKPNTDRWVKITPENQDDFPFEVPERDVKANIFTAGDDHVFDWIRDNLSNPWGFVSRPVEGDNDHLMEEVFFRFQTHEEATMFRLRF
jgi:hypothetical protein